VVQDAGEAFYRVEPGGAFVVATPAGEVTVTGTCFRVEVVSMKKETMVGAAVGAALSAAVLVTVYEGKVILANERGKTEVAAGERATMATGGAPGPAVAVVKAGPGGDGKVSKIIIAPEPPPAAGATREDLLTRDAAQRAELTKLRARVAELEAEQQKAGHPQIIGGHGGGDSASFLNPTHDELLEMAKHCAVQYDSPPIGPEPFQLPTRLADSAGLTADEQARVNQALADFNGKIMAQLRALYIEATGNTAAAEDLTAMAMEREIEEKSGQNVVADAMKELSAERAGLAPPPADPGTRPAVERMLRLMQNVGDMTEQTIANVVGPDKAHALRAKNDGWGMKSKMAGCKDEGGDEGQTQ
jgi:hypothetical protein